MSRAKSFLGELDYEASVTRKFLERVPSDHLDWRPHPKSMTLGRLAGHVAEIVGWAGPTIHVDVLDIAPVGGPKYVGATVTSGAHALEIFERELAKANAALASAGDSKWMDSWSLAAGGQTLFSMPRAAVMRTMVLNHLVHHRAQLGVYLRLLDIPVPQTYGPSADDGAMG